MKNITIKTEVTIPLARFVDQFTSACEGGSNYWCHEVENLVKPKGKNIEAEDYYKLMLKGFTLVDRESGKTHNVTEEMVSKAIENIGETAPWVLSAILDENDDAETGDQFLQLCTFGKVIYG